MMQQWTAGTARVTSRDTIKIGSEGYDSYDTLANAGGPSARTAVHPVLTIPSVVRPSTPTKTDYEP